MGTDADARLSISTFPFCSSICSYCNFNRGLFDADLKSRYVAALEREIRPRAVRSIAPAPRDADTIFFGGGTPSLLEPAEIARLIAGVPRPVTRSPTTPRSRSKRIRRRPPGSGSEHSGRPASIASASACSRSMTRSWRGSDRVHSASRARDSDQGGASRRLHESQLRSDALASGPVVLHPGCGRSMRRSRSSPTICRCTSSSSIRTRR